MFYLAGHWNLAKKELSLSCKPRSLPKPPAYRGRPSVFQRNFTTTAGAELGALDLVGSWFWCIHLHHFKGDNFYCVFLDGSFGSERSKSKIVQVYRFLMSFPVPKWFCISGWWMMMGHMEGTWLPRPPSDGGLPVYPIVLHWYLEYVSLNLRLRPEKIDEWFNCLIYHWFRKCQNQFLFF